MKTLKHLLIATIALLTATPAKAQSYSFIFDKKVKTESADGAATVNISPSSVYTPESTFGYDFASPSDQEGRAFFFSVDEPPPAAPPIILLKSIVLSLPEKMKFVKADTTGRREAFTSCN